MAHLQLMKSGGGVRVTLIGILFLMFLMFAGASIGYRLAAEWTVHYRVTNLPMRVTFPPEIDTRSRITRPLDIHLRGDIHAEVPVKQNIAIPMRGDYRARFAVDTEIPLDLDLHIETVVPVDVVADVEMDIDFDFQQVKQYRGIPVRAKLPVRQQIPISVRIPIEHRLPLRMEGPITVRIDHRFDVPLDEKLKLDAHVDQIVTTPVTSAFDMRIGTPRQPLNAEILQSELQIVPVGTRLRLHPD